MAIENLISKRYSIDEFIKELNNTDDKIFQITVHTINSDKIRSTYNYHIDDNKYLSTDEHSNHILHKN